MNFLKINISSLYLSEYLILNVLINAFINSQINFYIYIKIDYFITFKTK